MFIHKFKVGDVDLYHFGTTPNRPSLEKGVTSSSWLGKYNETNANVMQAAEAIKGAQYSQEEEAGAEKPTEKPAEEPKAEKKARLRITRMAEISDKLDKLAAEIEPENPVVAMYIDKIADVLEGK